jgi:Kef-type K+ transport system membrane component KefB
MVSSPPTETIRVSRWALEEACVNSMLVVGTLLGVGLVLGRVARWVGLPKVTGYIVGGMLLNPQVTHLIPEDFTHHTDLVMNVCLALITFAVGGTLLAARIRALGKTIVAITLFEAEGAALCVALGFVIVFSLFEGIVPQAWLGAVIPMSVILGALAAPTDPSATLAVMHEYHAKGRVSSTIMGVAGMDDVLGIINYSVATSIAYAVLLHTSFSITSSILYPLVTIVGGICTGAAFGSLMNLITAKVELETEGTLIVVVLALLCLCFGTARFLAVDELLATMSMGIVVVNFHRDQKRVFTLLERYTEELVFAFFFTLSGMSLNVGTLFHTLPLVALFVVLRALGKVSGAVSGASVGGAPSRVGRLTSIGLIPQGGIVIGLALLIRAKEEFAPLAPTLIAIVIGATVIHELVGPILSTLSLRKAGEIE